MRRGHAYWHAIAIMNLGLDEHEADEWAELQVQAENSKAGGEQGQLRLGDEPHETYDPATADWGGF